MYLIMTCNPHTKQTMLCLSYILLQLGAYYRYVKSSNFVLTHESKSAFMGEMDFLEINCLDQGTDLANGLFCR